MRLAPALSALVFAGFGLLSACGDPLLAEFGREGAPLPDAAAVEEMRAACDARGGTLRRAGPSLMLDCAYDLPDGGQSCRSGADCEGLCLDEAGTRQCQAAAPLFGCFSYVEDDGTVQAICVD